MLAETHPPITDEDRRLATLHALELLDSGPEREFDAVVALAAAMLDCSAAMLNLVDHDRVCVKASTIPATPVLPRADAMCDRTITTPELMVIDDLSLDSRFANTPLVIEGGVRFYAGAPLHAPDEHGTRHAIGTLCVFGPAPRPLTEAGRRALVQLATLAEALIAVRGTARRAVSIARTSAEQAIELSRKDRIFRQAERMAMIGSWRLSLEDERMEWSENVFRIHGLPPGRAPSVAGALDHYPPDARGRVAAAIAQTIETGEPFDFEEDFITATAERRRVRSIGEVETVDGRPVAVIGVVHDITEQHGLEVALRRSADTDALTGLANRAAFDRALEWAMVRARETQELLLLALIDLDGFKAVNDTLGHPAGDDVLREVGRILRAPWLEGTFAARLGGDEFALIVDHPTLAADPAVLTQRLESALRMRATDGALAMLAAGTVGICGCSPELRTTRDFIHCADRVLYAAKRARVGERRHGERRTG